MFPTYASKAVFPLGHGLSYTSFEYQDLAVESTEVPADGLIRLSFTVANTGQRAGDEVVQVYGRDMIGRTVRPERVLVAFRRLHLQPGAATRVSADVPASLFALWDAQDGWVVEPGEIGFYIGASSADTRLHATVTLTGSDQFPGAGRALAAQITAGDGGLN